MNILFFLTPKANCSYLEEDDTMRQALERMEKAGFAALPILRKDGTYCGTLTEGDLLWALKKLCVMDLKQTENHTIMEIAHRRDNRPVSVSTDIEDLVTKATDQNFVPVIDDRNKFIGIVTRKAIMQYCLKNFFVHTSTVPSEPIYIPQHEGAAV
jgi:CBS-domain-containing membrane protein